MKINLKKTVLSISALLTLMPAIAWSESVAVVADVNTGSFTATASSTAATAGNTASINTILGTAFGMGNGRVNIQLETIHNDLESHSQKMVRMNDILYDNLYNLEKRSQATDIDRQNKIRYEFLTLCRNAAAAKKREEAKKASQALAAQIHEESNAKTTTVNAKQQSAELNNLHRQKYCSIEEALKGFCEDNEVSAYPNADLDFGTLYGGAKESKLRLSGDNIVDSENGQVVKTAIRDASGEVVSFKENPNYINNVSEKYVKRDTLTSEDIAASKLLVQQIMGPPDEMLEQSDADLLSRNLNADVIARINARKARKSIISNIISKEIAENSPTISLNEWKAKVAGANSDYADKIEGGDEKISQNEIIKLEVDRRYDNYKWYTDQASMTQEGKLYEEYSMKALALKLQLKQLETLEEIRGLLAVTLAHQLTPITPEDVKKK